LEGIDRLDPTIYYTTPPITLGQHEGVLDVYPHEFHGRMTRHCGRRVGDQRWRNEGEWPTYDTPHAYFGTPKGLARPFHLHRAAIEPALGLSAQTELF
jgi:hypothetical protein